MLSPSLKTKLALLEGIPTLPLLVRKLLHTIEQDKFIVSDLEKIICQDPAISSRLLRVANSSFFGFSGKVGTLNRALMLLGTNFVKALALSMSIIDTLSHDQSIRKHEWHDYWLHSFACGWVAQRLIQHGLFSDVSDEAFLSGLLHDLGKPVLWVYEAHTYQAVREKIRSDDLSTHDAEIAVLGVHHGHVGGELAGHWKFPPDIHAAILEHHESEPTMSAARLIKVADSVVHNTWSDNRYEKRDGKPLHAVVEVFSIRPRILENVGRELRLWGNEIHELSGSLPRIVR